MPTHAENSMCTLINIRFNLVKTNKLDNSLNMLTLKRVHRFMKLRMISNELLPTMSSIDLCQKTKKVIFLGSDEL